MGQKAKNAGKKVSKTCDKLATAKSINPTGCRLKTVEIIANDLNHIEAERELDNIRKTHHSKRFSGVRPLNFRTIEKIIEDD